MSCEQSLRASSHSGLNIGLSFKQNQQILQMQQMKQKSRRVSLNAYTVSGPTSGKSEDNSSLKTLERHQSVETLSNLQSVVNQSSVESAVNQKTSCRLNTNPNQSVNNIGLNSTGLNSIGLNSGLNISNSNSNCNNSGISSALSVVTTASTMLPIITYDSLVMSRPNMDMNRVNRRMSKSAQESFTCSQQSILSAMDRFVKSVNNMDSTVLVPSKLRDMDIPSPKLQRIPPALANTDLHSFYLMLNDVKKELLWGPGTASTVSANLIPLSGRSSPRELKHIRQPSDDSLGSMGSTASSSSDQDTDSEADSMITDRDSIDEHTSHLAAAFRHHLQGLHTILHQLADSADFLSSRYQEEIDASSL